MALHGNLSTWNDRLNWAIQARGVKKAELARACGVERASVQEWTDGKTKDPKLGPFFAACVFLRVRPRWLALGDGPVDPLPDDAPYPAPPPPMTDLLLELAARLKNLGEDDQRRILELIMRMPEAAAPHPPKRRAAAP